MRGNHGASGAFDDAGVSCGASAMAFVKNYEVYGIDNCTSKYYWYTYLLVTNMRIYVEHLRQRIKINFVLERSVNHLSPIPLEYGGGEKKNSTIF